MATYRSMDQTLQTIFLALKTGSRPAIKDAKRELEQLLHRERGAFRRCAHVILEELKNFDAIKSDMNKAAFIEALTLPSLSLTEQHFDEVRDFVLKTLEYPHGHVRKALMTLLGCLRIAIASRKNSKQWRSYKTFLQELDGVIERHASEDPQAKHISEMRPSIYKSARMMRFEATRGSYAEQIARSTPELAQATEQNDVFFEVLDGDPLPVIVAHNASAHALEALASDVRKRASSQFDPWEKRGVHLAGLEEKLRGALLMGPDNIQPVFFEAIQTLLKHQDKKPRAVERAFDELNPFVRTFQMLSNHTVTKLPNGKPVSTFLYGTMITCWEYGRKKPEDWNAFVVLARDAHRAIDRFLEDERNELKKQAEELRIWLKKVLEKTNASGAKNIQDEDEEEISSYKIPQELSSVAHHVLDWYFQVTPWGAYRKSPEKLATIAIFITERINEQASDIYARTVDRDRLATFGGWSSRGSLSSITNGAFYHVIYAAHEVKLFLLDPIGAPKNWFNRLKEIAPALKEPIEV